MKNTKARLLGRRVKVRTGKVNKHGPGRTKHGRTTDKFD